MNNDKGFVDAYQSIYEHHQKDENGNTIPHEGEEINEAVITGSLLAAKGLMGAAKLGKAAGIAKKVGTIAQGVGAVRDAAAPRGKGQMNPQNEEKVSEAIMGAMAGQAVKKVGSAVGGAAKSVGGAVKDVAMQAVKKPPVTKVIKAHREVDLHDVEGNLTHQITDVITPEPLGERDEDMANRLWDEVVANLTTLGEMAGVRYQVTPLEEKKNLDPVGKEDDDVDNDGDVDDSDSYLKKRRDAIGKAMGKKGKKDDEDKDEDKEEKKSEKKETKEEYTPRFNVRSQVAFSTPEEVVEEGISDEQFNAFAPSIAEAHRQIYRD